MPVNPSVSIRSRNLRTATCAPAASQSRLLLRLLDHHIKQATAMAVVENNVKCRQITIPQNHHPLSPHVTMRAATRRADCRTPCHELLAHVLVLLNNHSERGLRRERGAPREQRVRLNINTKSLRKRLLEKDEGGQDTLHVG